MIDNKYIYQGCYFKNSDIEILIDIKSFDTCVVSFSNWSNYPKSKNNNGFARKYLEVLDVSAIYIIARDNHWWQKSEIIENMQKLKGVLALFEDTIALGSSMGAYGSLIFSKVLDVDRVIAFSPQFSIDRRKAPFENRWETEYRKVDFIFDDMGVASNKTQKFIFHTTEGNDNRHVGLFKSNNISNCYYYELPFSGHPSGPFLKEVGYLSEILRLIIEDKLIACEDITSIINKCNESRESSPTFHYNYIRNMFGKDNNEAKKAISRVLEKFPENKDLLSLAKKISE